MSADTIIHRLMENGRVRPNAPAYYVKSGENWVSTPWQEYVSQVRQAGRALIALGVEPGDTACMLGFNRPEWTTMLLGTMAVGGAGAGIYTTNSPTEVKYIIEHAGANIVLLEDQGQWEKVRAVRDDIPGLKHIVMMRGTHIDDPMVMDWDDFLKHGDGVTEEALDKRIGALEADQLASLIYTSGTTGPPKGVMLSHENLASTAQVAIDTFKLNASDSLVSYLPLSHVAEQMFTAHTAITVGYQVYYAESLPKLADNLREVQPTVMFGVPRIWERFYAAVSDQMKSATGAKAKIAAWATDVGRKVSALRNSGQTPSGLLAMQYGLANKLVYSKVKPRLGFSNMRMAVSGAAPINAEILEFFSGLDITIYEVYGQSEDCGPTTFNQPGRTKLGTTGPAWPGTEVKIAGDGEILVKGPNVFLGYYKNPEATAETLIDGWLQSGDLGKFDSDGFLSIVGRKKEIIITSGGKNIAPKNIEAALKNIELVAETVVIGERRKFLSALVTLEEEAMQKFAAANGIEGQAYHTHPKVIAAVQKGIDEKVNPLFARVENVRKFTILSRNFSIEDGELTPTLKIKRRIINTNFSDEIEAMYAGLS